MSMLARYKKAGGFSQLISLLEACDPEKQRHLLQLVGEEDPGWAVLVQSRILTVEKIFSWPTHVVSEILGSLPPKIAALACHQTDEVTATEAVRQLPHRQACEILEIYEEKKPTKNESHTASVRLVRAARDMERSGRIRVTHQGPEIDESLIA